MELNEIAIAMVGALLGTGAAVAWQRTCAHLGEDHVWHKFAVTARSLVSDRPDDPFLAHYFELARALATYVGKRLVAAAVAFLPVALVLVLLAPGLAGMPHGPQLTDSELALLVGLALGALLGWLPFRAKRR